jgi:hypothetical protein
MAIPGVGPITATAPAATVGDAEVFASGRHLAARLGLVPRQRSSGGKERPGGIPKAGDGHPRRLLVQGAQAPLRWREGAQARRSCAGARGAQALLRWRGRATPRVEGLLRRRPVNVAAVAIADKTARITRAATVKGEAYRRPEAAVVAGWVPGCEDFPHRGRPSRRARRRSDERPGPRLPTVREGERRHDGVTGRAGIERTRVSPASGRARRCDGVSIRGSSSRPAASAAPAGRMDGSNRPACGMPTKALAKRGPSIDGAPARPRP